MESCCSYARLNGLVEKAKKHPPLKTAVAYPCDAVSLQGADAAAREGLITPILVGPEAEIRAAAQAANVSISDYEILSTSNDEEAVEESVALARSGKAGAVMKGSVHTDLLMAAVVDRNIGLRTDRRMSHVFVLDVPTYKFPLIITDAALNISPDITTKKSICQNAIEMAQDLGVAVPKVALLAATETVNMNMSATVDAAILCKMADRGQIIGGLIDGPLAIDGAISPESVRIKKIKSPVAGEADVLVVPDIEAGNMIAKQLVYLASTGVAGLIIGGMVPVMLTSRADSPEARLASAALAVLSMAGNRNRAGK